MRPVLLALAAVLLAAVVLVALPTPPPSGEGPWTSPATMALAGHFEGAPRGAIDCSTCHYAFVPGFSAAALREDRGAQASFALDVAPVAAYEVAAAWAAPRRAGDGLPMPLFEERAAEVPPSGVVRVPFDVPWPAAVVAVQVWSADRDARPPLALSLEGPDGSRVVGRGAAGAQLAVAVPPGEGGQGSWVAVVQAPDPRDVGRALGLRIHAAPQGYEVRTDPGPTTGTRGLAHAWRWHLPAHGAAAPERLHVQALLLNEHPVGRWIMPAEGDLAFYEGEVRAAEAAPPPMAPFTEAEVQAAWAEADALLLHQSSFDGLRLRRLDDRAEWTRQDLPLHLRVDPACAPCYLDGSEAPILPPMPPGTTHVRATLTWELRHPAAPPPQWVLGVTQRPDPTFRYPLPTEEAPGTLVWVLPVAPEEWERAGDGWLQAYPLLVPDANGVVAFDGRFTHRVEALRMGNP